MGADKLRMGALLRLRMFFRSNRREIRFFLLFILYFALGQSFLYVSRSYTIEPLVTHNAWMSSKIINVLTPDEKTTVQKSRIIGSRNFSISVEEGCDGIESILLVVAAIWAFQMGVKMKIFGALIGTFIIYLANQSRIIVLYYTLKYRPGIFDIMHIYIGQILIIFIGVVFFIAWASRFAAIKDQTN